MKSSLIKINQESRKLLSKWTNPIKEPVLFKFLAKLQNFYFKKRIYKLCNKNKILFIGNMRQSLPVMRELKKNPDNIIIRAGRNIGRGFFNKYANFYLTFSELSKKEINNIIKKIDILVTLNDVLPFEREIVEIANKFNIPSLTTTDGFLSDRRIKEDDNPFINFITSKIILFSENQKQQFMKKGIEEERLAVTGYFVFDKYFNSKPLITKKEFYKKLNIPKDNKILLFTEEYLREDKEEFLKVMIPKKQHIMRYIELFKTLKDIQDLYLIIKPHPSGFLGDSFVNNLKDEIGFNKFKVVNDIDIHSLINASDFVLTRLSTTGFEAMIIKKPVIVFDTYSNTSDYNDYNEFNSVYLVSKKGDLKKVLIKVLKNPNEKLKNMEKFVNKHYSYVDGKSSRRVADLIEGMIRK